MPDPIGKISDSAFARRLLAAQPELADEIAAPAPFTREEMTASLAGVERDDEPNLMRSLRRLRQRVMLRVMARDLAGIASRRLCGVDQGRARRARRGRGTGR